MVFGDSHGVELAYALSQQLERRGESLKQMTYSACAPAFGRDGDVHCKAWTHAAINHILGQPDLKHVVVTYRMTQHLAGKHLRTYPRLPDDVPEAVADRVWRSYIETLQVLTNHGKDVHIVLQPPELPGHVHDMVLYAAATGNSGDISGVNMTWWSERNA